MTSINKALRKLRLQRISMQYMDDFYKQINAEKNDRGAAILAATFLEGALEYAVSRALPNSAANYSKLFESEGPLNSFDSKFLLADSLGILGPLTKKNLEIIKHVRNTFAHTAIPIDFSTKEIADACIVLELLPNPKPMRVIPRLKFDTPRQKFTGVCEIIAVALIEYASKCVRVRADIIQPDLLVPVRPPALP